MEIKKINTIKLEFKDDNEIYIMYTKPEPHIYECEVYAGKKQFGDLAHQFGFPVPQQYDIGIRVDSDEHYEEDIINLVMTNVNEGTIHWDADFFVE